MRAELEQALAELTTARGVIANPGVDVGVRIALTLTQLQLTETYIRAALSDGAELERQLYHALAEVRRILSEITPEDDPA